MNKQTYYVIVRDWKHGEEVALLLDRGYTLVISWVAGESVHHILSKDD